MKYFLLSYVAAGVAMLALDAVWLSLAASRLYRPQLGDLLLPHYDLAPAIAFYLLYLVGVTVFAVRPALAEGRMAGAAARGALLGLVAYATYDLTNQATLRHWPMIVTVMDLAWGTILTAIAAMVGYRVTRAFSPRRG